MRGVKSSTVVSHLADCIRAGLPVDIERLNVTDDVEKLIADVVRKPPINSGKFTSLFSFSYLSSGHQLGKALKGCRQNICKEIVSYQLFLKNTLYWHSHCYAPAPEVGALSDDARLTSVCLSVCLSRVHLA